MTKEIPILYSTPMIQAKLAGRKTQTRRIIKESFNGCWTNGGPHPCPNDPVVIYPGETYESPCHPGETITIDSPQVQAVFHCSTLDSVAKCPYGKPGDLLWAREAWRKESHPDMVGGVTTKYYYRADEEQGTNKYKPSIHMPKFAARVWDKIVAIRVERLQDISENDALEEGIDTETDETYLAAEHYQLGGSPVRGGCPSICAYSALWERINGAGSWDLNPWVWVITTENVSLTGKLV